MKNITTRIRNFTAAIALVACSFAPAFCVAAIEHPEDYAKVRFRGATSAQTEGEYRAFYNGGEVLITDAIDPVVESEEVDTDGDDQNDTTMYSIYTKSQSITLTAYPYQDMRAEARIDGQLVGLTENSYTFSNMQTLADNEFGYEIEFSFVEEGGNPPQPGNDIEAELHFACSDNSTDCFRDSGFAINGGYITGADPAHPTEAVIYHYDGDENDENVTFRAETLWHMMFSGNIVINNQEVAAPIDYSDITSWFDYYGNQAVGFEFEIPKAANNVYDITYNTATNPVKHIGNFLWSADPADEYRRAKDENGMFFKDEDGNWVYELDEQGNRIPGDDYVGHTRMELVAIEYTTPDGKVHSCDLNTGMCNITEYNEQGEPMGVGCPIEEDGCAENTLSWVEFATSIESETFEQGSLVIPAGARVTMRVIPDYGYQVLNVNMAELVTSDDGIGEFTFTVPAGAAYFVADVTATEDEVNADESEMVEAGSIDLGDDQTTLDHGTARLTIEDLALSDDEKKAFAEQVGDDGYEMKTYLDISLYNITYRGDTDSAWEEQVDDLNEEATITLQLADDVDGNDIVIVHKKHDGTYEVIPAEYDPVAHTITFKTSSFSDYAIASRTVASPDTGTFTSNSSVSVALPSITVFSVFLTTFALGKFAMRRHN